MDDAYPAASREQGFANFAQDTRLSENTLAIKRYASDSLGRRHWDFVPFETTKTVVSFILQLMYISNVLLF